MLYVLTPQLPTYILPRSRSRLPGQKKRNLRILVSVYVTLVYVAFVSTGGV
jgi:hypothetical protein